jgi:hypothetical protein
MIDDRSNLKLNELGSRRPGTRNRAGIGRATVGSLRTRSTACGAAVDVEESDQSETFKFRTWAAGCARLQVGREKILITVIMLFIFSSKL